MVSSYHNLNCSKSQMCLFKILHTITSIQPTNQPNSSTFPNNSKGIDIDLNVSIYSTTESGESESFIINQDGEETKAYAVEEKSVEVSQGTDNQVQIFGIQNNEIADVESESEEDRKGNEGSKVETASSFGDSNSIDLLIEAAKVISEKDESNSEEEKRVLSYELRSGRTRNRVLPHRYRDSVVEPLKRKQRPLSTSNTNKRRR
ncbi:hypothetical protein TanjilG_23634 [Lupinus angustifolius]|uniref:Uncharacterized protein n=1 Tax=Lupinus angustifolius TaxID=3871 RepID=A0A4P1RA12_LUPAN|nr:PREDICTED: uncharacterized protein LOC109354093 [Lupinus angustifolius]OIW05848.1 hypothetical protein TanjilG_23634 [Lupinus angustifolius]